MEPTETPHIDDWFADATSIFDMSRPVDENNAKETALRALGSSRSESGTLLISIEDTTQTCV